MAVLLWRFWSPVPLNAARRESTRRSDIIARWRFDAPDPPTGLRWSRSFVPPGLVRLGTAAAHLHEPRAGCAPEEAVSAGGGVLAARGRRRSISRPTRVDPKKTNPRAADRLRVLDHGIVPNERGYHGPMHILVGMDLQGVLTGVVVDYDSEPYGYFSVQPPEFVAQFKGKSVRAPFRVGEDIDAVSRATITITAPRAPSATARARWRSVPRPAAAVKP